MNDLELLKLQAEGSLDDRGRVAGLYGIKVACCEVGQALFIGAQVPDAMAGELARIFDQHEASRSPLARGSDSPRFARLADHSQPPAALEQCRPILGRSLRVSGGPSYLIEATSFDAGIDIKRSDLAKAFRIANPRNWHPIEWNELLDGILGPWTMALEGERVVSLCHTPGPMTARAAECGVWTDPAFRGRGYAAAVTSEWAAMLSGRHLFYSTDAENLSSQRVAQRLKLRPLGWIWRLGPELDKVHPLSTLRR
jgi:hypothetical protein